MKRLLILAAILLAVAAALWLDRDRPTTDQIHKTSEQLFPGLDPGRIDHLTIDRGAEHLELQKKNGWWLADGTRADDAAIDPILSTLTYGRVERVVSIQPKVDRVHLIASGKDLTIDLRIGDEAAGRGVYVQRGRDFLVAEARLWEVLQGDFRSRAVVLDDPAGASTIQIGPLALERHAGGWRIIEPRPALADSERVASLLNTLGNARADKLLSGPAPSPAPNDELLSFDSRLQARIRWKGCGNLPQVIRADGAVLCFSSLDLHPRIDDLREPHLANLRLDDIDAIDLELSGKSLSLRHRDHAWQITAPPSADGPADDAAVRERLRQLLELRARAFGAPGSQSLGTIHLASPTDEVTLSLAKGGADLTALRKPEDSALLLPAKALALFDPDPLSLRSKRVDTFRPDQVTSLSADGSELKDPRILDALSNLHAERVQNRDFAPHHTLRVVAAGKTHTFSLGPRDSDGCLVRTDGPAFVLAPPVCSVLYAPFEKSK
jgi:hypothetical protein